MTKQTVHAEGAPEAIGPYSQAVLTGGGNLVFTAGQIPMDPDTGTLVGGDINVQTRRVLLNLQEVLRAAGSGLEYVIKTTVFLKNMDDFQGMNEAYAAFFTENPPARSAVEAARLPRDVLVEIECVALVP